MPLAFKYCIGRGLELGAAAHNPFDLPDCRTVAPCDGVNYLHPKDLEDYGHYKNEQMKLSQEVEIVDLVGDFQNIPAEDGSLDYSSVRMSSSMSPTSLLPWSSAIGY